MLRKRARVDGNGQDDVHESYIELGVIPKYVYADLARWFLRFTRKQARLGKWSFLGYDSELKMGQDGGATC